MLTMEQAIRAMVMGQQRMIDLSARLPEEKYVYPGWTMKQVIDHLTGWDEMALCLIEATHGTGNMPDPINSLDVYNTSSIEKRKPLPLRLSIEEYVITRKALVQAFIGLPKDVAEKEIMFPWGSAGTLTKLLQIWVEHEESHRNELFGLLKG